MLPKLDDKNWKFSMSQMEVKKEESKEQS